MSTDVAGPLAPSVQRLLAVRTPEHRTHTDRLGPLPDVDADVLVQAVADAGLTGRGGAAFPTARKLAAVAAAGDGVVVANGSEGEPASSKDRELLTSAPHLVLDGLLVAARAARAQRLVMYAPEGVLPSVARAAAQRRDVAALEIVASVDTFVAGQASAVVAGVSGRPAVPSTTPPSPRERGVGGRPTLVLNVETLACLALIARFGPTWYRQVGTTDEPGTRLVTISGAVRAAGVYEAAGGARLDDLLSLAGGPSETVQAVLVGGYHGGWVPWLPECAATPLTRAALAPFGAAPGAGVLVALPATRCPLEASERISAYLAGQSAAQCGPCRNGLPTLASHLGRLARGRADASTVGELARVAALVDGRGACHHPDGTARFVRSTMTAFAEDVQAHLSGRCVTGAAPGRRR